MNLNFTGLIMSLLISCFAILVMGHVMGLFGAVMTASIIILSSAWYWTLTTKNASERVHVAEFGGYLFRVEVA